MAETATIQTEPRTITGKRVRKLRRGGLVPANVYGRGVPSVSIQVPLLELRRVFRSVERNAVVNLQVAGESGTRPVVLREVQRNPVSGEIYHVELFQIDLTRTIQSAAPLVLIGDAPAVSLGGVLVQNLDEIHLEALPMEMPSEVEVDISGLTEFGHGIHVEDLKLPASVRVLADPTTQIVSVLAPRLAAEDEAEEEAAVAAAAVAVAGEEGDSEAGEGGADGAAAEGDA